MNMFLIFSFIFSTFASGKCFFSKLDNKIFRRRCTKSSQTRFAVLESDIQWLEKSKNTQRAGLKDE